MKQSENVGSFNRRSSRPGIVRTAIVRTAIFAWMVLIPCFPGGPEGAWLMASETRTDSPIAPASRAGAPGTPLPFIENVGQFDQRVRFQVRDGGTTLHIADDALWIAIAERPRPTGSGVMFSAPDPESTDETGRRVNLKLSFVGAGSGRVEPMDRLPARTSFFTGNDPSKWHKDVPTWGGVRYRDLYPGADLEVFSRHGRLALRFVVRDGVVPHHARLRVEGADSITVAGGHLSLATPLGAFQLPLPSIEGAAPDAEPAVVAGSEGAFEVENPFAAVSYGPLPTKAAGSPNLLFSTYLGGGGDEVARDIVVDSAGRVYIASWTDSPDFPTTVGAFDSSHNGGSSADFQNLDAAVTILAADGTLLASTYLGGGARDHANGIALGGSGCVYVTGATWSANFPTTPGVLGQTGPGGGRDAFVVKLSSDFSVLVYSTYLGGTNWDYGRSIAVDSAGNAYVGGFTHGSYPTTTGAAQESFGGAGDGFIAKINADADAIIYGTYIGGNSWDSVEGLVIDDLGQVYVAGGTHSSNFPTTPGSWDPVCDACQTNVSTDAIAAKLSADGSTFVYSTTIGVTGRDEAGRIAIDTAGNAYLIGSSESTEFPTTPDALQSFHGGDWDAVVVKLNADGSDLLYGTYLGGTGTDMGLDMVRAESTGFLYLTGATNSADFPTANAIQTAIGGGDDAFVAKLDIEGEGLLFSTWLGGSGDENVGGLTVATRTGAIAVDEAGDSVYVAGHTSSADFPLASPQQPALAGPTDGFVTKLTTNLLTSTYLGGGGDDLVKEMAVDGAGNAYLAGLTNSADFPTTAGVVSPAYNGDPWDAFVTIVAADGSLFASTYLGGSAEDNALGIAVDDSGCAYVSGGTWSADFPTTPGVLDGTLGGQRDAYVAKLCDDLSSLVYGTYLGGSSWDYGRPIAVDAAGNAYVGGFTHGGFPTTSGAAQESFGGAGDGFITKINAGASAIIYSTYIGGDDYDNVEGLVVDNLGQAYVAGGAHSTDFPTTPGAWDPVCDACTSISTDGFAAKLSADGSTFIYSTTIGSTGGDEVVRVDVDPEGNAYLIGYSRSTVFPVTAGALQSAYGGGDMDVVVVKLNADGSDALYSTYLGGSGRDQGNDIVVDQGSGIAHITGSTDSADFPIRHPLQGYRGGYEAFVAMLNPEGERLLFSTWLGGSGDDNFVTGGPVGGGGHGAVALYDELIYLTGTTSSTDFPIADPLQSVNNGGYDTFFARIQPPSTPVVVVDAPSDGDQWTLSEPDMAPNSELISWTAWDEEWICRLEVTLLYSDNGGTSFSPAPAGGGLPATFGPGGDCAAPGVLISDVEYVLPTTPPSGETGSLYKIRVRVTDREGLPAVAHSGAFFMAPPDFQVKTLILSNVARMQNKMGVTDNQAATLRSLLRTLAEHQRVDGVVVELSEYPDLGHLYEAWDLNVDGPNHDLANNVLFGCHDPLPSGCSEEKAGIHDVIRELLSTYTGVEYLILVGDDRIIPMARIQDGTVLFSETNYTSVEDPDADPGLTATGSTVGQALAADRYLSDDPLAVRDALHPEELSDPEILLIPDLAIGRLVENPEEIIASITTFISQNGTLDLSIDHKVLVTGYDFLLDSGKRSRERWKDALGVSTPPESLVPVDGSLLSPDWDLPTVPARREALWTHLSGNGGERYGIMSLNGHATHYEAGVPGINAHDIQGLNAVDIYGWDSCQTPNLGPVALAGGVVYAVGCHGGLSVPGSCANPDIDPDHSLDLPQTMLARGVLAYLANSGYGWGLKCGIGYGERLIETMTEEMTRGGTIVIGEVVRQAKLRYFMETDGIDQYDAKSLMQWTLYTGIEPDGSRPGGVFDSEHPKPDQRTPIEHSGSTTVARRLTAGESVELPLDEPVDTRSSLPQYVTQLSLSFGLTGPDVYVKYDASGEVVTEPGCPDQGSAECAGCYYELNGRAAGDTDLPIQPHILYNSGLAGTSQHGVLWTGGTYEEETGWVPLFAELMSNGGDGSNHGTAPRHIRRRPTTPWFFQGGDPAQCQPDDGEINTLIVPAEEVLKANSDDPTYSIERRFQTIDLEVLYFNNTQDGSGNCDRTEPELHPGPYDGDYHQLTGGTIDWAVPVTDRIEPDGPDDPDEVWRVLVVYNEGTEAGHGSWLPLELTDDGSGTWTGSLDVTTSRVTYFLEAVDRRGNVTWLEYVATGEEEPASGVPLVLPLAVRVDIPQADLAITKDDGRATAVPGETVSYAITVTNNGPSTVMSLTLTDTLPAELEDPIFIWSAGSYDSATGVWSGLSLEPGQSANLTLMGMVDRAARGQLVNTASVSPPEGVIDPDFGNNTATDMDTLAPAADLAVTKDDGRTTVVQGEAVTYTVTVTNGGPSTVMSLTATDTLPAEIENAIFTPCSGTYDSTTGLWHGLSLEPGRSVCLTLDGTVAQGATGQLVNTVSVSPPADVHDPDTSDNIAEDVDQILPTVNHMGSVSDTGDGLLVEGEEVRATITQLYVIFNNSVSGAGDTGSFLLLEAGGDEVFQTTVCDAQAQADDVVVPIDAAVYDDSTLTSALWISGGTLQPGRYRLLVCASIRDMAGNPLTAVGGGDFARDFSVEVEHILLNPNFDVDLAGWLLTSPLPGEIAHSQHDVAAAPTSGSALVANLQGPDGTYALSRCLPVSPGYNLAFGGSSRISSTRPDAPVAFAQIEIFDSADCSGDPLPAAGTAAVAGDSGGLWQAFVPRMIDLTDEPGADSVLISFVVQAGAAAGFEINFDDLFVYMSQYLFEDGFESGDASAWSPALP